MKMWRAVGVLFLLGAAAVKSGEGAAVFTRWGKASCPEDTEMVYRGYTGGSSWKERGGSAQLICLPEEPIYAAATSGFQGESFIYATEYESSQSQPPVNSLNDHDMPCAVCMARQHQTTLMVPARNECYQNWKLQYQGYLWGGPRTTSSKDYICVDVNLESAGGRHKGGLSKAAVYVVEASCGSGQGPLPCPPYIDGWELTCAVCTLA